MAREMVAIWRAADGLVGVPGQMSRQTSDPVCNPGDSILPESAGSKPGWRSWIPSLDRMPPLVQFFVRGTQWIKAKSQAGAKQTPQLRLVAQLALGAKRHLSLVEVGGVQFLIGGGVEHVTVIVPIPTASPLATEDLRNAGRQHQP